MKKKGILQRVQNFTAKSINGKRKYDSATASLKKSKLLNLKTRHTIHETVFAHSSLIDQNPENICKIFQKFKPFNLSNFGTHSINFLNSFLNRNDFNDMYLFWSFPIRSFNEFVFLKFYTKITKLIMCQSYNLLFEKFLLVNFTRTIRMSDEFKVMNSAEELDHANSEFIHAGRER